VLEDEIKKLRRQLDNLTIENKELLRKNNQLLLEFKVETQLDFSPTILLFQSTNELGGGTYKMGPDIGHEYVD
jgi:hypothetical protein